MLIGVLQCTPGRKRSLGNPLRANATPGIDSCEANNSGDTAGELNGQKLRVDLGEVKLIFAPRTHHNPLFVNGLWTKPKILYKEIHTTIYGAMNHGLQSAANR